MAQKLMMRCGHVTLTDLEAVKKKPFQPHTYLNGSVLVQPAQEMSPCRFMQRRSTMQPCVSRLPPRLTLLEKVKYQHRSREFRDQE